MFLKYLLFSYENLKERGIYSTISASTCTDYSLLSLSQTEMFSIKLLTSSLKSSFKLIALGAVPEIGLLFMMNFMYYFIYVIDLVGLRLAQRMY